VLVALLLPRRHGQGLRSHPLAAGSGCDRPRCTRRSRTVRAVVRLDGFDRPRVGSVASRFCGAPNRARVWKPPDSRVPSLP
jgi:hypothetical protein